MPCYFCEKNPKESYLGSYCENCRKIKKTYIKFYQILILCIIFQSFWVEKALIDHFDLTINLNFFDM